jgi:hypothetical protein
MVFYNASKIEMFYKINVYILKYSGYDERMSLQIVNCSRTEPWDPNLKRQYMS